MARITRMELDSDHIKASVKVSPDGERVWALFPNGSGFSIVHSGQSLEAVRTELYDIESMVNSALFMQDVYDKEKSKKSEESAKKDGLVDFFDEQCSTCEKGKGHEDGA